MFPIIPSFGSHILSATGTALLKQKPSLRLFWRMQVDPVVYQLQRAVSQDPIAVKDAEGHLNNWKKEPGFFGKLYSIFLDKQNDMSLRWIAIIQLRNSIDIIWRKNTKM